MMWGPPVGIVAVTANVSPSITEMLLSSLLVMYANRPSADHGVLREPADRDVRERVGVGVDHRRRVGVVGRHDEDRLRGARRCCAGSSAPGSW